MEWMIVVLIGIAVGLFAKYLTPGKEEFGYLIDALVGAEGAIVGKIVIPAFGVFIAPESIQADLLGSFLGAWIHPHRAHSHDGIPAYAAGIGELLAGAGPLIIRTFDSGKGRAARDRELALGSPVIAILGAEGNTPLDWLKAGMALDRLLLRACANGISASFLNQPIEVLELRSRLKAVVGEEGDVQTVLRLGYGPMPPPTPRRRVEAVLLRW